MRIEKLYYKEWHDDLTQMKKESEEEDAAMTEEERADRQRRSKAEVDEILESANLKRKKSISIPRPLRKWMFHKLSRCLLTYAEEIRRTLL